MVPHFSQNKKGASLRKVLYFAMIWILLVGFLVFLAWTNIQLSQKKAKLSFTLNSLQTQVKQLEAQNQEMRDKIAKSETNDYLEKIAREKYNLKSPGEQVAVITGNPATQDQPREDLSPKDEKKINWYNPVNWVSFLVYKIKLSYKFFTE